jgi:hypothetical protein
VNAVNLEVAPSGSAQSFGPGRLVELHALVFAFPGHGEHDPQGLGPGLPVAHALGVPLFQKAVRLGREKSVSHDLSLSKEDKELTWKEIAPQSPYDLDDIAVFKKRLH